LFLQPKVHIGMQRICGAEGLVRWLHPARGLISPAEFIPLAEECGLIVPIGEWALLDACSLNQAWAAQGLPRLPITVNVSPRQFHQSDLVQAVKQTIGATGQGEFLHLELTESSIMKDPSAALRVLQELKWLGMKISLDDFGTGYSSLSYLDKLPLDELKIDRSFLQGIKSSGDEAVLVDLIIGIARKLDLTVVAEGVETREQLRYLASRGCDQIQGYLVSKPLSAEEFTAKYLKRL
jgi:EAL domain-containing protein (putative c-di-GMP-specific phosphodiesterase class I)